MIDFDILRECGTTNERLREVLTAKMPEDFQSLDEERKKSVQKDLDTRKKIESVLQGWVLEHIVWSLRNHKTYGAVDLAWDSTPINRQIIPLIMYAQNRIKVDDCANSLISSMGVGAEQFIKRDSKTKRPIEINLPKFFEVNINLIRSFVERRTAAQVNKYNNLFPFFKYESRTTGEVGKLRADVLSQRMDIMADQYDYRRLHVNAIRDMFLYGHSVCFPRSAWEREVQWEKEKLADEYTANSGPIAKKARVVKEGVAWTIPHPSRLFWDINHPLASLNSDTGCEYVGFWDVDRWGNIANDPNYFNKDVVGYSNRSSDFFTNYSQYFSQYYTAISPPGVPSNLASANDRKNAMGSYSANMQDSSIFTAEIYWKMIPQTYGIGTYPYPVWLHIKFAGETSAIYAEIMPSSPGAVFSLNENDSRLINISTAHELMGFQDQLTNLFSQLLETAKADMFQVGILNTDVFPDDEDGKKARADFENVMKSDNFYATTSILQTSFSKLTSMGMPMSADNIFKIIRNPANQNMQVIFQSITTLIETAERLMAMAPQEQGQTASHEISATESAILNGSTETVYSFISGAIDDARAAMKRICYEAQIALGSNSIVLPVVNRYPESVIKRAGFTVQPDDTDLETLEMSQRHTIIGSKNSMRHDYIFTSRDGANRPLNTAAATALTQLLQGLFSSGMAPEVPREKIYEMMNEIFRLLGSVDLNLEMHSGESTNMGQQDDMLKRVVAALTANSKDIAAIKQALGLQQPAAMPAPQAA